MTIATAKNIRPYITLVKCAHCNHMYKPRSRAPSTCPRCFKTFDAVVIGDSPIYKELEELKDKFIQIDNN